MSALLGGLLGGGVLGGRFPLGGLTHLSLTRNQQSKRKRITTYTGNTQKWT